MMNHNPYATEHGRHMVDLVRGGRALAEFSRELFECSRESFRKWVMHA